MQPKKSSAKKAVKKTTAKKTTSKKTAAKKTTAKKAAAKKTAAKKTAAKKATAKKTAAKKTKRSTAKKAAVKKTKKPEMVVLSEKVGSLVQEPFIETEETKEDVVMREEEVGEQMTEYKQQQVNEIKELVEEIQNPEEEVSPEMGNGDQTEGESVEENQNPEEEVSPETSEEENVFSNMQLTRTERFQEYLSKSLFDLLADKLKKGKVSRNVAYKVFKECFDTIVEFVRTDEENRLPLAGIGTFMIKMSPPRKPVRGEESKLSKFSEIPHFKWKPSDRYKKYLFKEMLGYEEE